MNKLRIALFSLARTTFDLELAQQVADSARSNLIEAGFELVGPKSLITNIESANQAAFELKTAQVDLLVVFQATFADSTMIATLSQIIDTPIFLWAVPEERSGGRLRLNSFCGINLAGHALTLAKRQYDYAYAPSDDKSIIDQIATLAMAGSVHRRLKTARFGVIGDHPEGMDSCHLDETSLHETFGISLERFNLSEIFESAKKISANRLEGIRSQLDLRLDNLTTLDQAPLMGSLSVYAALKQIADEKKLDGLAIRCWPEFFTELGCAACGAMSMLSDGFGEHSPTPCSCEADINGTITQLILQWIAGEPAFGTDLVSMDFDEDNFVLWHCGLAPLSMADPEVQPRAGIHSNRKVPLVMEFPLKPGKVTLARISQATGQLRLVIGQGQMLASAPSFSGTSGVLRFEKHSRQVFDTIMAEGLEHHLSLVYGDYVPTLQAFARLTKIPTLSL